MRESGTPSLAAALYEELRAVAHVRLRSERRGHTLETSALVHEAFQRLQGVERYESLSPSEYLMLASRVMHRILVDHARARGALMRGGDRSREPLHAGIEKGSIDLDLILDAREALTAWEDRGGAQAARQVRVFEHHVYGGLPHDLVAQLEGCSRATVQNDWRLIRAHVVKWIRDAA